MPTNKHEKKHPLELRIPPAILFALTAVLMWLLARYLPWGTVAVLGEDMLRLLRRTLGFAGLAAIIAGWASFARARTTVDPTQPGKADQLVTTGFYRISRNPMYLGFTLMLLAWAVRLQHLSALVPVIAFVWWMNRFQIEPEERALNGLFGDAYRDYCRRVRRWI